MELWVKLVCSPYKYSVNTVNLLVRNLKTYKLNRIILTNVFALKVICRSTISIALFLWQGEWNVTINTEEELYTE
jgi:hypothetical protein